MAGGADQDPLEGFELLQALAGAHGHCDQGIVGDVDRHAGLVLEALVEAAEEG